LLIERTADPSAALGMTKGRLAFHFKVVAGNRVGMTKERAAFPLASKLSDLRFLFFGPS
jgi:hypothetical protein